MNESLCSVLSGEDEWYFDTEGRSIKFNKDGSGEVRTAIYICVFVSITNKSKSYGAAATSTTGSPQTFDGKASIHHVTQAKRLRLQTKLQLLLRTKALNFSASLIYK